MVARHVGLLKRWWWPGLAVVLLMVLAVAWVLSRLPHDEVSATVTIPTYGALEVRVDTGTRQFEVKRPHATMHVLDAELETGDGARHAAKVQGRFAVGRVLGEAADLAEKDRTRTLRGCDLVEHWVPPQVARRTVWLNVSGARGLC